MPRINIQLYPLPEFFSDWKQWGKNLVSRLNDSVIPEISPGMIIQWPLADLPDGWLLCDGTTVKRDAFPELFGVINTDYNTGGEGADEFSLPSLTSSLSAGGYIIRY